MRARYKNDFKVMIVELLKSGQKIKNISIEYDLNDGMIRRWRREFEVKKGDLSKKKRLSTQELEIKLLKKEVAEIKMSRSILISATSPRSTGKIFFHFRKSKSLPC
jgi:transposase